MKKNIITLLENEEGAALVEYTLLISLVVVGTITILETLGTNIVAKLTAISNGIENA